MMYPILCKVQYESLHKAFSKKELWKQIGFSVFINWIIAPFLMVSFCSSAFTPIRMADTYNLPARSFLGISSR